MFSILLVVLCGGASAEELIADDSVNPLPRLESEVGEPEEVAETPLTVASLDSSGSVVSSFSLTSSSSSDVSIVTSDPILYGVSGSQSFLFAAGTHSFAYQSNGQYYVSRTTLSSATTGLYYKWDSGLTVEFIIPISASYPDVESVDIYGTLNCAVMVGGASVGSMFTRPNSVSLIVGDTVLATGLTGTSALDYSYTLGKGETVNSITVRCFYDAGFDLMATSGSSTDRYLKLQCGPVDDSSVTSTSGWFTQLFAWLSDIRDGISSVASGISSGFSNVVNSITALPGKIADAIKGLFVPSDEQFEELRTSFGDLLESKLGFVYEAGSLIDGVLDAVFDAVDNPNYDASFSIPVFPAFDVDGTNVQLWDESLTVDFSDNEFVTTAQDIAYPFVIALMVWAFVHSMEDAFFAFVAGDSLSDWIRNRGGRKDG